MEKVLRVMIKLLGMFCIITASLLMGAELERRMKRRWQIFREMKETLIYLEKEMTYHRSPIQEAFQYAAGRCATELKQVLDGAAAQIGQRTGCPFEMLWEEALDEYLPAGLFPEDEKQLFLETSAALCNTDVVMQRTLLEKYTDRFQTMGEKEAERFREKGGLYRKLAAAAGVFLVILLF